MTKKRYTAGGLMLLCLLFTGTAAEALTGIEKGMVPPPFTLPDRGGKEFSLATYAGSPLAIIFWSTWSPRSAELLEDFRKYHGRYGSQGLKIVGINIDGEDPDHRQRREIRAFAAGLNLTFPLLFDEDLSAFVSYGVMAHPSTVLIGREGKIVYTLGGYPLSYREELEEEIQKALGIYKAPTVEESPPVAGYIPRNGALQYFNLGRNLMARGQAERARSAFQKAMERDPSFIEPAIMSARLALADGAIEEVETFIRSADLSVINRNDLRYMLGFLMLLKEKEQKAEGTFSSLEKKPGGEGWGKWGLGLVRLAGGREKEALVKLKEADLLLPDNPEAEAFIRRVLVAAWRAGETSPGEEELTAIFPAFLELKNRYQRMFGLQKGED